MARSQKRCAVYRRKSSEEGLLQDFNSLDAQDESCSAYILSQTGEGWSKVIRSILTAAYQGAIWIGRSL